MSVIYFPLFLLILVPMVISIHPANRYCHGLCPKGVKHIACNNHGGFAKKCGKDSAIVRFNETLRDQIIEKLKFENAVWNKELARLAELRVKKCKQKDVNYCTNTRQLTVQQMDFKQCFTLDEVTLVEYIRNSLHEYDSRPIVKLLDERPPTHIGCSVSRELKYIRGVINYFAECFYMVCSFGGKVSRKLSTRTDDKLFENELPTKSPPALEPIRPEFEISSSPVISIFPEYDKPNSAELSHEIEEESSHSLENESNVSIDSKETLQADTSSRNDTNIENSS